MDTAKHEAAVRAYLDLRRTLPRDAACCVPRAHAEAFAAAAEALCPRPWRISVSAADLAVTVWIGALVAVAVRLLARVLGVP
jgi:hypothetical protein